MIKGVDKLGTLVKSNAHASYFDIHATIMSY